MPKPLPTTARRPRPSERARMQGAVRLASDALNDALENQHKINTEVNEFLATGKTMTDLHNAQSEELCQIELEREKNMGSESGESDDDVGEDLPHTVGPVRSQDSGVHSQGSGLQFQMSSQGRSQSTAGTSQGSDLHSQMPGLSKRLPSIASDEDI
ncbi:hypothetical protein CTA2_13055 [Colletotrichum tanaceti]|uniref:Uncharacterized protein n=1 Tax=Colletotrichum tanaceti TaxID=1306861 RepID=A0A4U6X6K1_9PEZI|nr:hypothetical protein CTA2_13055 [Colletotrichum tanaceti]TKW50509.1 hypothetical protein CTA1_10712 [Colletotrichum tanaceti]